MAKAKVEIESERCKGCGLCVEVCGEQVLELGREINLSGYRYVVAVRPEDCVGCCRCAEMCPDTVLAVWR